MADQLTYSAGIATAYGAAVRGGYTGTYAEFCALMADYANIGEACEEAATSAAESEQNAEAWATGQKNGADVPSTDPAYQNNAKYYAGEAETAEDGAESAASDAEAYGAGTRGGAEVVSGDPAYHNNAPYYVEEAEAEALKAEGYAAGTQDGTDVESGSPYYHANAEYYKNQASGYSANATNKANAAAASALEAEGYAKGTQDGEAVASGSPYYQANSKYYSEQAAESAEAAEQAAGSVQYPVSYGVAQSLTAAQKEQARENIGASIDSALSESSTNSVQNKVITAALNEIAPLAQNQPVGTKSGSIVSVDDAFNFAARKLIVGIDPVQSGSGDPSPDNIRPISGWTGANVYHSGADTAEYETVSVPWEEEAGTVYGGTLNVITGLLTVDRAIVTITGGCTYRATTMCNYILGPLGTIFDGSKHEQSFANRLNRVAYASTIPVNSYACSISQGYDADLFVLRLFDEIFASPTACRDATNTLLSEWAAAGTPLQIVYPMKTPVTYQLTATQVNMLLGVNNVWADTGNVELTYIQDINAVIASLQALVLENNS